MKCPRCGLSWGHVPADTFKDGSCDACRGKTDGEVLAGIGKALDFWFDAYWRLLATGKAVGTP